MNYENPKPPFVATHDDSYARVVNAHGVSMVIWLKAAYPDWAERQAAAIAELTERFTPKCPIRKGFTAADDVRLWYVVDAHGITRFWEYEAERDAVYDALVALWHKENP